MPVSDSLLLFFGFALAHAVWNVSDLPDGESLIPLAFADINGGREGHRFVAETQAQAIAEGRALLAENDTKFDAWALAYAEQCKRGLHHGVLTHKKAAELWPGWAA